MLSLSFYSSYTGFLAWAALIRPFMIIGNLEKGEVFKVSFLYSFFLHLFLIYWVALVTIPGMIGAVLLMALYNAIILVVFNKVYRLKKISGLIVLPFLWVGLEYFRTLTEFSFPWSDLGYTQSYYLKIMQIVSVISVHGLSFLIVVVNILLMLMFIKGITLEKKVTAFFTSGAIVVALVCFGWIVIPKYPLPGEIDVALLQGSVPIEIKLARGKEKLSYDRYDSLATAVKDSTVKLYVWPETAVHTYMPFDLTARQFIGSTVRKTGAYHLVGSLNAKYVDTIPRAYNSAFQFNPNGIIDSEYDKVKLVPFSEHVPYQDYLPFLEKANIQKYLTFIKKYNIQWWSDFYPGDSIVIFETPDFNYSVLICFESTFPEFVRETIHKGADFIVGITNDTWFNKSVGIHMHARIFLTRAIENRCWGVRVANSGITYIVDDYGRIRDELGIYEIAALKGSVNKIEGSSIFNRYGDLIGRYSFLITVSTICILIILWISQKFIVRKKS